MGKGKNCGFLQKFEIYRNVELLLESPFKKKIQGILLDLVNIINLAKLQKKR